MGVVLSVVVLVLAVACVPAAMAASVPVTVTGDVTQHVRPGFLGLSFEIRGIEGYTGDDPKAVNPVFEQLIRNLDPGQKPMLRLGGDTGDWTWYPVPGMSRPIGVRYTLTNRWLAVMKSLAEAVNARMTLAVNLEVNSTRVAAAEARAFISGIGSPWLEALQLGNEPELYNVLAWFAVNNVPHYGRPPSWDMPAFLSDYAKIAQAMPDFPLAGPEVGAPAWVDGIGQFLGTEPRVKIVTVHRYALGCDPAQPPTITELLSDGATRDFTNGLGPALSAAHDHGLQIRLDESNTVSCGGQEGLSNTFAAALWDLDVSFEVAQRGFNGINFHTREGIANQLFSFSERHNVWSADVAPDYYGLLAFGQAAPAGSALLRTDGPTSGPLHVWATRAPNGVERSILINMAQHSGRTVALRDPGHAKSITLERLTGPSAGATDGVTFDGERFAGGTTTGLLAGRSHTITISRSSNGSYSVWVPPASAAIVDLGVGRSHVAHVVQLSYCEAFGLHKTCRLNSRRCAGLTHSSSPAVVADRRRVACTAWRL
jgi:Glycosyl hydrolase family 79 C-terminal beta domain